MRSYFGISLLCNSNRSQLFIDMFRNLGSHPTLPPTHPPTRSPFIGQSSMAAGLCNGSRGVVERFTTTHRHPVVRFASVRRER